MSPRLQRGFHNALGFNLISVMPELTFEDFFEDSEIVQLSRHLFWDFKHHACDTQNSKNSFV